MVNISLSLCPYNTKFDEILRLPSYLHHGEGKVTREALYRVIPKEVLTIKAYLIEGLQEKLS